TEVLLNSFIHWGKDCLQRLNGMFSFAIWDKDEESLFVARDRFGVKPFYYSLKNDSFYFASEIPAFFAAGIPAHKHEKVWASYFVHGTYGTGSDSFWKDILSLEAGHYLYYKQEQLSLRRWYRFEDNIAITHGLDAEEEEHIN